MSVHYIPAGCHTVTPYLVATGAARLIDFMKAAFGAEEVFRMPGPDGTIAHAEVRIGDSLIELSDGGPEHPPMPCMLHLYVEDCDAVFERAVAAGATVTRELEDEFYGDRAGGVKDPSGNQWFIATHKEDVTPEEMSRRLEAMKK